ncbi:MAG: hypothetical protein DF168_01663 [Candidatus Moanabacter tarae]|uniref:Outer membrane protein beta-barrel domain-containing protein n=1 Tax=Candidatus Moanibacter tarae TaxID=2200854 RepID=A0A2Z4ADS7_9BACT|nr:MAG: hypothetical protein DF168_01663 [Candidatus Moanabacter tarae]
MILQASFVFPLIQCLLFMLVVGGFKLTAQEPVAPEPIVDSPPVKKPSAIPQGSEALISKKNNVRGIQDSTVAEALGRRPDLKFSNVKIDGEDTRLSISDIPTEAVSDIDVLKSITPDLDANSRGGSVSLRSKPSFELETPVIKSSLGFRYTEIFDEINPRGSLTIGSALGKNRRLGARLTLKYQENAYGSDGIGMDWQEIEYSGQSSYVLKDHLLYTWKGNETEIGLSGNLDYKISDRFFIYLRGNWEEEDWVNNNPKIEYRFSSGEYTDIGNTEVTVSKGDVKRDLRGYENLSDESEIATGGFYEEGKLSFNYQISHRESHNIQPDFFTIDFIQENVDMGYYRLENSRIPRAFAADDQDIFDPTLFQFEDLNSQVDITNRSDFIASLNLKHTHRIGSKKGYFKSGFKFRERSRERITDDHVYDQFNGSFTLADVLSDFSRPSLLKGQFNLNTVPDLAKSRQFLANHLDQFVLNERRTRERADAATYDAGESIVAYYGMGTFHRKYLTFLAGLRVERTETNFTGNEVLISDSGEYLQTNPVSGSSGYTNTFPSLHLRMDRGKRLTFIGSWTKAIERPRFSSLTPYRRVDLEDRELYEGNPDLKPTLYSNLDLSLDYNLHDDDLLSLEFFYKTVDDVIFSRTSTLLSGTYAGFERSRDENSASGSLWGIELTWYQSLDSLPLLPKGLKLNTNYIYSNSEFEYPNRPEQPLSIANHPNQKLQLAITYDLGKFYAQLKIERQSNTVSRVGDVPEEDRFKEGITEVALNASCRLSERLRIVGGVRRLTDTPSEVVYEGNRDQLVRYRYPGQSANIGLKYEW